MSRSYRIYLEDMLAVMELFYGKLIIENHKLSFL